MIKKLLLLQFILLSANIYAKDDSLKTGRDFRNTFYINGCYQRFPGIYKRNFLFVPERLIGYDFGNQIGAYYERNIYKGIILGGGYAEWTTLLDLMNSYGSTFWASGSPVDEVGSITLREHYKMIDLYAGYRYRLAKRHEVQAYLGYSKTWGDNWVIDAIYADVMESRKEKGIYNGLIAQTQYRYLLFKERVAVGINIRARKYFGLYNYQLDYGYYVAINF